MIRLNCFFRLQAFYILWLFTVSVQPIYAQSCIIGNVKLENIENTLGIALLIGNNKYQSRRLKYPVKDATTIARVLKDINFSVALFKNLKTKDDLDDVTFDFMNCLKESREFVALFYFSGYGMHVKDERHNFLLPIFDKRIRDKASVKDKAFKVEMLFDRLQDSNNKLNIVILDACREYPKHGFKDLEGLGDMLNFDNSIVAYPTNSGKTVVIPRRKEKNSLYVKYLAKTLELAADKGMEVIDTFNRIHNQVMYESGKEQSPIMKPSRETYFCWGKPCQESGLEGLDVELDKDGNGLPPGNDDGNGPPRKTRVPHFRRGPG